MAPVGVLGVRPAGAAGAKAVRPDDRVTRDEADEDILHLCVSCYQLWVYRINIAKAGECFNKTCRTILEPPLSLGGSGYVPDFTDMCDLADATG